MMRQELENTLERVVAEIQESKLLIRYFTTLLIRHKSQKKEERYMALSKNERKKKMLKKAQSTEALAYAYRHR